MTGLEVLERREHGPMVPPRRYAPPCGEQADAQAQTHPKEVGETAPRFPQAGSGMIT